MCLGQIQAPPAVNVFVRKTFLHFSEGNTSDAGLMTRMKRSLSEGDLSHALLDSNLEQAEKQAQADSHLMIRNIPCRLTEEGIKRVLDATLPGMYESDSLYVPKRPSRKNGPESNLGYFFITLTKSKYAPVVTELLAGKPFGGPNLNSNSKKFVEVSVADSAPGVPSSPNHMSSKGKSTNLTTGRSCFRQQFHSR